MKLEGQYEPFDHNLKNKCDKCEHQFLQTAKLQMNASAAMVAMS